MQSWILHVDMDAFFASVEQLDHPELRGKPIVVGGQDRGVVAAASYEARKYGIHSAMPSFTAKRLCPHLTFVKGRHARYSEKSHEIMDILREYSPLVEPASIDEAYLDLTGLEKVFGSAQKLAYTIQKDISQKTMLTCSVGLAPVKFLAKIASDLNKPNGVSILLPEDIPSFLTTLPVQKIPGVGEKTLSLLTSLGIVYARDIHKYPLEFWERKLGKGGEVLYKRASGVDTRKVEPIAEAKSESAENTFAKDTKDTKKLATWLLRQAERVGSNLRKQNLAGKTITLKVKFSDFTQVTRSRTLKKPINATMQIYHTALDLLTELAPQKPIRLIGVGVSHFGKEDQQLSLLPESQTANNEREIALDSTLDSVRKKFGRAAIIRGKLFHE